MRKVLLSVLGACFLLLFLYFISAWWEGQRPVKSNVAGGSAGDIKESQDLLVGDYVVYYTFTPTPDDKKHYHLWRYFLNGINPVEITSFIVGKDNLPSFYKFSDESLVIKRPDGAQLWHIKGDLIGPAENIQSLISPDRRWLAKVQPTKTGGWEMSLENISTGNQRAWAAEDYVIGGYLLPKVWSDDSRLLYLTAATTAGISLPGLWVLDIESGQVVEYAQVKEKQVKEFTIYPKIKRATGITDKSIWLVDLTTGELTELLRNNSHKVSGPKLDELTRRVGYTLLGGNQGVWLADFINPQKKSEEFIASGKLLAWPNDDFMVIADQTDLKLLDLTANTSVDLANSQDSWQFIDVFSIK